MGGDIASPFSLLENMELHSHGQRRWGGCGVSCPIFLITLFSHFLLLVSLSLSLPICFFFFFWVFFLFPLFLLFFRESSSLATKPATYSPINQHHNINTTSIIHVFFDLFHFLYGASTYIRDKTTHMIVKIRVC